VKLASNALCVVIDMETKMYSPKRISINEVYANYCTLSHASQLSRNKRAILHLLVIASLIAGAASKRKYTWRII